MIKVGTFSTYQQNNSFENSGRSMSDDVQNVIDQLFKLLRCNLKD